MVIAMRPGIQGADLGACGDLCRRICVQAETADREKISTVPLRMSRKPFIFVSRITL